MRTATGATRSAGIKLSKLTQPPQGRMSAPDGMVTMLQGYMRSADTHESTWVWSQQFCES